MQDGLPWHNWELREFVSRVTDKFKDRRPGKEVDMFSDVQQLRQVIRSNRGQIDWTEDDVRTLRRVESASGISCLEPELFHYYIPRLRSTWTSTDNVVDFGNGAPGPSAFLEEDFDWVEDNQ